MPPEAQTYKTVIGGNIHRREAPTRQGLDSFNTERILMKQKRQESPRQAAFTCEICAGFQMVPNSAMGGSWWRGPQNPDSEIRLCEVHGLRQGRGRRRRVALQLRRLRPAGAARGDATEIAHAQESSRRSLFNQCLLLHYFPTTSGSTFATRKETLDFRIAPTQRYTEPCLTKPAQISSKTVRYTGL